MLTAKMSLLFCQLASVIIIIIIFFLSALLDIHIKGYILLYKQRKLQGIRPMGLAQTGQRDPCKAPPLTYQVLPALFSELHRHFRGTIENFVVAVVSPLEPVYPRPASRDLEKAWHSSRAQN